MYISSHKTSSVYLSTCISICISAYLGLSAYTTSKPAYANANTTAGMRKVKVDVERDNTLSWTGPCRATWYAASTLADGTKADSTIAYQSVADIKNQASIPAGDYDVVVTCPSTEGDLSDSKRLTVGKSDTSVRIDLVTAFLLVNPTRDGREVKADVTIKNERGFVVGQGREKMVFPVPAGSLQVEVKLTQDKNTNGNPVIVLADTKTKAKQKETLNLDVSDGEMTVDVMDRGENTEGMVILRRPGRPEHVLEFSAHTPTLVPPGVYDVVTQNTTSHDFSEKVQRGVRVEPRKKINLTAQHSTVAVAMRALIDGNPIDTQIPVDVRLFLGAAIQPFNSISLDEVARLSPGKYRVEIIRTDETLDDGSAWMGETSFEVSTDDKIKKNNTTIQAGKTVDVDLTPAQIEVETWMGGVRKELALAVWGENSEVPLLRKNSSASTTTKIKLPIGKYRLVGKLSADAGAFATEEAIQLKAHQTVKSKINLEVGIVTVQIFAKGVAVPGEILFYAVDGSEPLLRVPAGVEALLPPGAYRLVARRKKEERQFEKIRVSAGSNVERQIEWESE